MKYPKTFLLPLLLIAVGFITLPGCCKTSQDCNDGSCAAPAGNQDDCVCLVVESQGTGVDPEGNDVWCESCVVYCLPCDVVEQAKAKHQAKGTAACPAIQ